MGFGFFFTNLLDRRKWLAAMGIAIALATAGPGFAQTIDDAEALKAEIQALKKGQAAIQRDLAVIKQLLQQRPQASAQARRPAFEPSDLGIADAPYLGKVDATVTLVEFTDYQCPYCRRHSDQTKPLLIKEYVEAGKLKYVLREFPIAQIHPKAPKAAEAALCAGDQDKYWAMNEVFFANQRKLGPDDLKAHAEGLGLDMASFSACLDGGKYTERVRKDLADGVKAGVRGTPSFFLGLTDPADPTKIKAIKSLHGAQPYIVFKAAIDALLAEAAKGS